MVNDLATGAGATGGTPPVGADPAADTAAAAAAAAASSQTPEQKAAADAAAAAAQTPEQKAAAEAAAKAAKPAGAPDAYENFKDIPAGLLSPADVTALQTFGKAQGFTQAQLQAVAERDAALALGHNDLQQQWQGQIAADLEIGGAKLDESRALAGKAVDTYFPGLKAALASKNPMFDNPEVFKGLVKLGKALQPDTQVNGSSHVQTQAAPNFYPKSNHAPG